MAGSTSSSDIGDATGRHSGQRHRTVLPSRPVRVVLRWQALVTVVFALVAAYLAGLHGAISAVLGGAVSVVAGLVFIVLTRGEKVRSAESVLLAALRAEGAKIVSIIVLLWLILSWYTQIVTVAFFATFALTVIIFSLTLFVREK